MSDPQVTSTHCFRGHVRNDKSTRWFTGQNGRRYPMCRKCESIRRNAKYAADPAFREWSRAKSKTWHAAHRAQQENV